VKCSPGLEFMAAMEEVYRHFNRSQDDRWALLEALKARAEKCCAYPDDPPAWCSVCREERALIARIEGKP